MTGDRSHSRAGRLMLPGPALGLSHQLHFRPERIRSPRTPSHRTNNGSRRRVRPRLRTRPRQPRPCAVTLSLSHRQRPLSGQWGDLGLRAWWSRAAHCCTGVLRGFGGWRPIDGVGISGVSSGRRPVDGVGISGVSSGRRPSTASHRYGRVCRVRRGKRLDDWSFSRLSALFRVDTVRAAFHVGGGGTAGEGPQTARTAVEMTTVVVPMHRVEQPSTVPRPLPVL